MESKIYKQIALIMADTKAISKGRKNQQQGFMFRGIDDIMNELHEIFAKHEVFILPEVLEYKVENRQTAKGNVMAYIRMMIKFRYMTTDGSYVETTNLGEAMDSADKAANKAMSIALKYSLLQMLLIPTEDMKDPDAVTPPDTTLVQNGDTDFWEMVQSDINNATNRETLMSVWNNYPSLQKDSRFTEALSFRRKTIGLQ